MKKIFLLFALCMACMNMTAQDNTPQWIRDLCSQNKGLIDSTGYYNAHPSAPGYRTYVLYYHQPLVHAHPNGPQFPLRVLITVNVNGDPTTAVNHVYASGYSIMEGMLYSPDSIYNIGGTDCSMEIAHRYNANYISIEHRYFQYSAPVNCWENLDPLRAEEAAADFHNLFEGLKKVLKGKWVMSGVSKGGITTLLQHAFYPEDMDIYVPYSAPFFDTDRDKEMTRYWYHNGWDQKYQDFFMNIRKSAFSGLLAKPTSTNTIWPIYFKMNCGSNESDEHIDSLYASYLSTAAFFGITLHTYWDTVGLRLQMHVNDSILRAYHWNQYNDTAIAFMLSRDVFHFAGLRQWLDTLRKYPDPQQQVPGKGKILRRGHSPFGVTAEEWWGTDTARTGNAGAYEYQSKRELGYYDIPFDELADSPEDAATFQQFWESKMGCFRNYCSPWFAHLTYSRSLYDFAMEKTLNATKPIVLLYGLDDPWTGAAVKDEYINGTNVKKYILPAQNHLVTFSSNTDITQCNAIRATLDAVLGSPQDIEHTAVQPVFNGKSYNILGQEVDDSYRGIVIRDGQKYLRR